MATFAYTAQALRPLTVEVEGQQVNSMAGNYTEIYVCRPRAGDPHRHGRGAALLAYGYCTTGVRRTTMLAEVYGAAVHATFLDGSNASSLVSIQVSLDGGTTFLVHDGVAWVPQLQLGNYNSTAQFNEYCSTLPLQQPALLQFRLRVSTTQGQVLLHKFLCALEFKKTESMLEVRAAFREQLQRLRLPLSYQVPPGNLTAVLPVPSTPYAVDRTLPVRVFDLAHDPNRNTNLATGFRPDGAIQLSGVPVAGARLEVQMQGSCPVIVGRRDELQHKSGLPITIARIREMRQNRSTASGFANDYKIGLSISECRTREAPQIVEMVVAIEHWTSDLPAAVAAPDAIGEVLRHGLSSPFTGERLKIIEVSEGRLDDVLGDSYYSGVWEAKLVLVRHASTFYTSTVAKNFRVELGDSQLVWVSDGLNVEVDNE